MVNLNQEIAIFSQEYTKILAACTTLESLEEIRIQFLGRKGTLSLLMEKFKESSLEQKKIIGPLLQELKKSALNNFEQKKKSLRYALFDQEQKKHQYLDVTAYKKPTFKAGGHIYSELIRDLEDFFISMGFDVVDGPELETDYYNFETMNIPKDHPARDAHDTFWVNLPNMLLRTHTSSIQAHQMEKRTLPLAIFAPGRCYRNEATDASHDFIFMQAECLYVDKNVSMANLIGIAELFLKKIFARETIKTRVRPGFFPFVEPGVEIDSSCPFCDQKGCSMCKKTGWIELMGAGLIHPNVLRACGIDPTLYSGFALGMGLERIAMIKYGINDIRLFRSNNLSFLRQF